MAVVGLPAGLAVDTANGLLRQPVHLSDVVASPASAVVNEPPAEGGAVAQVRAVAVYQTLGVPQIGEFEARTINGGRCRLFLWLPQRSMGELVQQKLSITAYDRRIVGNVSMFRFRYNQDVSFRGLDLDPLRTTPRGAFPVCGLRQRRRTLSYLPELSGAP